MNTLTRTIAVLIALNLSASGLAVAQDVSEEELRDAAAAATEAREADIAKREADIAAREAQRQTEIALARAKSAAAFAPPTLPSTGYSTFSRNRWPSQSGGTGQVLVIPSAEIETKDLLTINEDLNVMSRIFETNLQRAHMAPTGGSIFVNDRNRNALLSMLSGRSRSSVQSLYLQGYGVLFLMKVDFPLSAPPQTPQEDGTDRKEEGDKVWERMRQEMYEPERVAKSKTDDKAEKYDPEKVENLRTTLVESLKHASNIRNLKPEESVILTVTGGGDSAGDQTMVMTRRTIVVNGHERVIQEPASVAAGSPTVLVVRAKKADIDSFAADDLDLDQFRQRVQMISYPYLQAGYQRSEAIGIF